MAPHLVRTAAPLTPIVCACLLWALPANAQETTEAGSEFEAGSETEAESEPPAEEEAPAEGPEAEGEAGAQSAAVHETVVVGASEAKTSGALHILNPEKLARHEYDDPQAVLQSVPGVYARGEDGFGLRPNVGLRGANSDRSKKVTLLEDGVLFGPAPYSAPAAYYFPLMTRIQAVRVLKGPSAIVHGPQTVGGSIDFITRDVPWDADFGLDLSGGEHGTGKLHLFHGGGTERWGFLIEGLHLRSSGFKELDGGGPTGFYRNEWMAKARHRLWDLGALEQSVLLKVGYSDEVSNETYLGLSDEDFLQNPLRRYRATALDRMDWQRTQVALTHRLEGEGFTLLTTGYRHDMNRTWRKVNRFSGGAIAPVFEDPHSPRNALLYGVLTGEVDSTGTQDTLLIGPNARTFVSQGVQSVARFDLQTGPLSHQWEVGARYHYDSIQRNHAEDTFAMQGGRLVALERPTVITADNKDWTHAVALHAQDAVGVGPLTVTPGVRAELIRSVSTDALAQTRSEGRVNVVLPGVGAHVALTRALGAFAGVHAGFSPPAPGAPDVTGPERSVNYEAGARWMRRGERVEVIGFFNDYSNLTDICTFSNGCLTENLDRQFSAGRARIQGVEALAEKTFRTRFGVSLPISVGYTLTDTALLESFQSADPHFGNVTAGDELPYVPRHQGTLQVGVESLQWGVWANAHYTSAMRERAGQGPAAPGDRTDSLLTVDVGASWYPNEDMQLYLNARNLLDEAAIVSRRPYGARPNAPRTVLLGFKYSM